MMEAMEAIHLFDRGEYMVIFVDMMSYSAVWVFIIRNFKEN